MPIQVTCPGCLSRFQVSEKFAGKKGPCPKCKKEIQIPALSEQVVIHAPESGPKDAKGQPVLKPIRRIETKFSLPIALAIGGASLVALIVALAIRLSGNDPPIVLLVLGTILLAPPLAFGGYLFLHNDELEGFRGQELMVRSLFCALAFAITWALYAFVPKYLFDLESLAEVDVVTMGAMILVMIAIGAATSVAAMELEIGQGVLHYGLYFVVTLGMCIIMGVPLAEPLARADQKPTGPKATTIAPKPDAAGKVPVEIKK